MGTFDDSFSIELTSPIDEESWKVLTDAELDNTEHIYFTTPSGKRVDFIKVDVLDKIRAEIEFEVDHRTNTLCAEDVFAILDKYKADSEVQR